MKKIATFFVFVFFLGYFSMLAASPVSAAVDINDAKNANCQGSGGVVATVDKSAQKIKKGDCVGGSTVTSVFRTVANILLFLIGALAVIMFIIGGFRYVVSNGDQTAVTGAKNTILYAIIGIVVAFLAFAAVNFVAVQLQKG